MFWEPHKTVHRVELVNAEAYGTRNKPLAGERSDINLLISATGLLLVFYTNKITI